MYPLEYHVQVVLYGVGMVCGSKEGTAGGTVWVVSAETDMRCVS